MVGPGADTTIPEPLVHPLPQLEDDFNVDWDPMEMESMEVPADPSPKLSRL